MSEHQASSGWQRFWERGGWWRALIVVAVYYALFQLAGLAVGAVFGESGGLHGEPGSAMDVFIDTGIGEIIGTLLLIAFALSLGWMSQLFGPQPYRGRGWMWVGIGVVLAINISSLLSLDYADAGLPLVASWLFVGLFVGFTEEVLTRGFVVNMMRKAGHGEIAVALVSSGIFAALHAGNLFTSDQDLPTTLLQVVYTFAFGMIMYLALRVTGNLIWPILLHASTDPTLFLHGAHPLAGTIFGLIPALSTYLVIVTGFVLMIVFIVGERRRRRGAGHAHPSAAPAEPVA